MKISSSLLLLLAALLTLVSGCSTVSIGGATVRHFPKNTLVIRNHTSYEIEVFRNEIPWEDPKQTNTSYHFPIMVAPHEVCVIHDCTAKQNERVIIGLRAAKVMRVGCLVGEAKIGNCKRVVNLGTNNPPQLITVRSWHF